MELREGPLDEMRPGRELEASVHWYAMTRAGREEIASGHWTDLDGHDADGSGDLAAFRSAPSR